MHDICHYDSPLGGITLACDGEGLTGLWFDGLSDYRMLIYAVVLIVMMLLNGSPRIAEWKGNIFSKLHSIKKRPVAQKGE